MNTRLVPLLLLLLGLLACSGSHSGKTAMQLAESLSAYPDYSVILDDMREEGAFLPRYFHKYKLVYGDASQEKLSEETTDWLEVDKSEFRRHAQDLGMALVSRASGAEAVQVPQPAGWQYVGDERYGQWRDDGRGGSFWEFYGKWMFMSTMFDLAFGNRVMRGDWGRYRESVYSGRRPFYGSRGEFGTNGSITKQRKPAFYQRSSSSFRDRVAGKMGRTAKTGRSRSSMRSRSGGFGKQEALAMTLTVFIHGLLYLALCLFLLGLGRAVYGWLRPGLELGAELVTRDNAAFAVQQIGYWSGLLLIVGGVVAGPSHGIEQDLIDIAFWGALGIVLLNLSMWLNDRFILPHFDNRKEILQDQNAGTGAVEAGSALAAGLLVHGALTGEGSLLSGLGAWAMGQVVLIAAGLVYTRIVGYNLHQEIEERDNVPAGIAFGGMLVATGNLLRFGTAGDFDSWSLLLTDFLVYGVLALLFMWPIRLAADRILLPGEKLSDEIARQDKANLGAGLVEAFAYIAASVLISWCF